MGFQLDFDRVPVGLQLDSTCIPVVFHLGSFGLQVDPTWMPVVFHVGSR